jgi:hypothetical protein
MRPNIDPETEPPSAVVFGDEGGQRHHQRKRNMPNFMQPGCLDRVISSIAEAAARLPERDRVTCVRASLDREIRNAGSLARKASTAKGERYDAILDVLKRLCVKNPSRAASEIVLNVELRGRFCLERFLERCEYATAHQAIQAVARVGLVRKAVNRYKAARQDVLDVGRLLHDLQALRSNLNACAIEGWHDIEPLTSTMMINASNNLG